METEKKEPVELKQPEETEEEIAKKGGKLKPNLTREQFVLIKNYNNKALEILNSVTDEQFLSSHVRLTLVNIAMIFRQEIDKRFLTLQNNTLRKNIDKAINELSKTKL